MPIDRLGDFQTYSMQGDSFSDGRPSNAIAARYDLPAVGGIDGSPPPANWTRRPFGAVDAKVVDYQAFRCKIPVRVDVYGGWGGVEGL
jgi:hypothetical protein